MRRVYAGGVSAQQRLHLPALLILALALPLSAQDSIHFQNITQADFEKFSRIVAQGVYADPVQPARSSGLLGFDVGVAATVLKVDTNADYWKHSVTKKITVSGGYVGVPRLVVSKGWGGGTISGTYAKITDTGAKTYGGSIDLPIIRGTVASPELALRGAYSTVTGVDVFKLKTYGVEAFVSKGFGPLMPYIAAGRMRSDSRATVDITGVPPPQSKINFKAKSDMNRYTVGLRISLFLPKIVVEATQAEQRSYSAKVSIGF